jgi:hypothetical protein
MLKGGMGCKNRVVWLNNGCCGLWSRVDAEFQLALLAIVDGQTLHEESTESRSSSATERVEDEEALESRAVVCNTANLVQNLINEFLANSVVATSVIVGGILLASNHMLRVEKTAVGTSSDLIHDIGLKVAVNGARNIFALACYANELAIERHNLQLYWCLPVSEKKVLNPWSGSAALRSSVRYPSG